MVRIRVTPEQVRQVGSQFKQASSESQAMVNKLQQAMNQLEPEWEGLSRQRFYSEYQNWRNSMNQFVQLLDGVGRQLDDIARKFESVDQR
jgi:WXG100 family type VII secretion target